jgi:ACS family glucarate transporter-like MFS transporter
MKEPPPVAQRPAVTGVRHGVLALTTGMAVLLYLDRICIAVAAPAISDQLCLTKVQMGLVFGAFFLSYALMQVPAGWLGDRFGARRVLTVSVLAWSLATALTGLVGGLWTLLAARLLLGVGEAGAYPIAARIQSRWVPFRRRAFASSVVTLGGRAGGAIAPGLTALLILTLDDWRPVFWLYAVLGVFWTVLFWDQFRDAPREHPECSSAEVDLIEAGRPPDATDPAGVVRGVPWSAILRSRSLWLQCLMQLLGNVAWTLLITWLPTYLMEVYRVDLGAAGLLSSLPLFAGMAGCLLGGLATDRLTRRFGLLWGRSLLGLVSRVAAGLAVAGCFIGHSAGITALALTLAAFATDLGLGATWAYFQDAGGPYVGTLLGWANMFGNLGAFLSPLLLGYVARDFGWPVALAVCAGLFVVSGLCWFGIDARVPIVSAPDREPMA